MELIDHSTFFLMLRINSFLLFSFGFLVISVHFPRFYCRLVTYLSLIYTDEASPLRSPLPNASATPLNMWLDMFVLSSTIRDSLSEAMVPMTRLLNNAMMQQKASRLYSPSHFGHWSAIIDVTTPPSAVRWLVVGVHNPFSPLSHSTGLGDNLLVPPSHFGQGTHHPPDLHASQLRSGQDINDCLHSCSNADLYRAEFSALENVKAMVDASRRPKNVDLALCPADAWWLFFPTSSE